MEVKKIAVIGAGAMGNGIAQVGIMAGYTVTMNDVEQRFIDKGKAAIEKSLSKLEEKGKITAEQKRHTLSNLITTTDIKTAVADADLVIEAVFENMELKKKIFTNLGSYAPKHAILASNTSSMSISEIAAVTGRPEKVVGMHFFNPATLLKLVEVIYANHSSDESIQVTCDVATKMGKVPVIVRKDSPGFIVNRVNAPLVLFHQLILDKGEPTPQRFDAAFKAYMPMAPFELWDYVGIDIVLHTQQYYADTLSKDYTPRKALKDLVASGNLGMKTGKGIYDWSAGRPQIDTTNPAKEYDLSHMLAIQVNEATKVLEEGVAKDPRDIDIAVANGGNGVGVFSLVGKFGYEKLVARLNELVKTFGIETFKPTKTMMEGSIRLDQ